MNFRHSLFLALLAIPGPSLTAWETVAHDGKDYVTARSIRDFYKFDTMEVQGDTLVLENKAVQGRLPLKGTQAFFNQVKFHLAFPLVKADGRYLVSRITLAKTIEPILRPVHAGPQAAAKFTTIVIDPAPTPDPAAADLTRQIALEARKRLEAQKCDVVLTRDKEASTLEERLETINTLEGAIVISLHITKADDAQEGLRSWVLAPVGAAGLGEEPAEHHLQPLPGNVNDFMNIGLATSVHSTALMRTRRPDRGIARSRDSLLARSKHPALILEVGNLANEAESTLLKSPKYREAIGKAIAEGVRKAKTAMVRLPAKPGR